MTVPGATRTFDVHGLVRLVVVGRGADSSIVHHFLRELETAEQVSSPEIIWYLDGRAVPEGAVAIADTDGLADPTAFVEVHDSYTLIPLDQPDVLTQQIAGFVAATAVG